MRSDVIVSQCVPRMLSVPIFVQQFVTTVGPRGTIVMKHWPQFMWFDCPIEKRDWHRHTHIYTRGWALRAFAHWGDATAIRSRKKSLCSRLPVEPSVCNGASPTSATTTHPPSNWSPGDRHCQSPSVSRLAIAWFLHQQWQGMSKSAT
jgi:hypothetical protein